MSGWSLATPNALWLLLALPVLWWRARTSEAPASEWTGSIALWRSVSSPVSTAGTRRSSGVPWPLVAALFAFTLAVLALADPRQSATVARDLKWRLVLDRSPSMFLPLGPVGAAAPRIERAVELAIELCERSQVEAPSREWTIYAFDGVHSALGARPPQAWLSGEWGPAAATPWQQLDLPSCVWISDTEPAFVPQRAGLVRCGAEPIPGPVADLGDRSLSWDGEQLVEAPWTAPRSSLFLSADLPSDIDALARLWAGDRKLPVVSDSTATCLRVARSAPIEGATEKAGRLIADGWSVDAQGLQPKIAADFATWAEFEGPEGQRFAGVRWRPGSIEVALASLAAEQADPAIFSVSWTQLFDRARLSEPAVVELSERRSAGPPMLRAPQGSSAQRSPLVRAAASWLALLAGALVLLALILAGGARRRRKSAGIEGDRRVRSEVRAGLR
jgi:hypothetical protein